MVPMRIHSINSCTSRLVVESRSDSTLAISTWIADAVCGAVSSIRRSASWLSRRNKPASVTTIEAERVLPR